MWATQCMSGFLEEYIVSGLDIVKIVKGLEILKIVMSTGWGNN
jgi:hypothetical protein